MYNISEKSKLYSEKNISKEEVYKLLSNDFSQFQIDMLFADKTESLIETKEVYDFICENKDLTKKEINVILNDDVKLFLRIHTHKGTWYSDDYVPYCGQMQVKCSSPRMVRHEYGNKCPECGNEIGLSGLRLIDSPLNVNKNPSKIIVAGRYGLAGNSLNLEDIKNNPELSKIVNEISQTVIDNEITINPDEILQYPDGSITDSETIRQIALWSIKNNSNILNSKISKQMEYAGLYPHVMRKISQEEFEEISKYVMDKESPKFERQLKNEGDLNWIELDLFLEAFKNSETNINFRVDTRDFYCIKSVKDNFSKLSPHTQHTISKYFKRFTYSRDEVINALKTSFEKSGGEGEWRMLSYIKYPNETNSWQLKYLNVIYVGDKYTDLEGKFIITDGEKDSHRLLNKDMWYTEIDEELLCHH